MRVIPARTSIIFTSGILVFFLLVTCFAAFSGGVAAAKETAYTNSETAVSYPISAAPAPMQSSTMGCGTPSFGTASYFSIGGGTIPISLAVADFNSDGKPDVVTANQTSNNVSVLLGNGDGSYASGVTISSGAINPSSVAVGDFNLDSKLDIAVSHVNGGVSVLLGNGMGGFGVPLVLSTIVGANDVVTGDFNGDGKPDIAVARSSANGVSIFSGDGMGGFAARVDFPAGTDCFALRAADFNGDGKLDIATANFTTNDVSILLGNGLGSFGMPTNFPIAAGSNPRSIRVGDLDRDGDIDLVTSNAAATNGFSVLLNNGNGSFGAATNYSTVFAPQELTIGDLNGDGKPDIAVSNGSASSVSVRLGNGSGSFAAATDFSVNDSVGAVVAADVNLDGKADLVMRSVTGGPARQNVAVLLNTCSAVSCSGINLAEAMGSPYNVGAGTDPSAVATGDFNRDGKPDLAVPNFSTNNVSILLGNGMGSFTPSTGSPFAANTVPFAVEIGDYNRDGKQDLAIANGVTPGYVTVLLGDGSGGFAPAPGSPFNLIGFEGANAITTGDFNRDGNLDIATANGFADHISILSGNGSGGFMQTASIDTGTGTNPRGITVGDFNLDGKLDLATANNSSNNVTILLGNGSGGFAPAAGSPIATGGTFCNTVSVGDFNLDGKPDLVVTHATSHNMSILLGNGNGGFALTAQSPIGETFSPRSVTITDFNVDGKPDIIASLSVFNDMAILKGNGDGTFVLTIADVPGAPYGIAAGDFNLDGKPDLAATQLELDSVTILLNTCPQNSAPTITATPVSLQQTTSLSGTQIATVSDAEDAESSLMVTVNSSTSATVNGVTISNLTVDAAGVVRANVNAACGSSNAMFTLTVKDSQEATNSATLNVTVTPETIPPTLNCPANITQSTDVGQCAAIVSYTIPTASDNCPGATVQCSPASGSSFTKGITTVTCTATDAAMNTAQCSFSVTVNDTQAPTITCPSNITVPATAGQCQAVVSYTTPTVSDNCSGVGIPTCIPASGATFQTGTTTVNCSVTDAAGNANTCLFTVTVNDTQNPTISCPGNMTVPTTTGQCQTVVTYPAISVSDNCSGVSTPSCVPPSGSTFQKGTTTVNCSVTDAANNSANCSFTVTVNDTEKPVIACPANITQSTDANQCSAVVSYTTPTATDNCSGATVQCTPASGSTFPKGLTTVSCVATDVAMNTATCTFTVTINDTVKPVITCPSSITVPTATGQCQAVVTYAAPTVSDNCSGVGTPSCTPTSGSTFPKGTTTVNCSVTDAANNSNSCSFTVTVNDTENPTISCPSNIIVPAATGQCQAVVTYAAPSVSDNCPGVGTPTCSPLPSGSTFPVGTTTITCTVMDAANNSNRCSFTIQVRDTQSPTINCPANVNISSNTCVSNTYTTPIASDNCAGASVVCNPPASSCFPVGTTTVTCTATDAPGLTSSCSFTVSIVPCTITCPANVTKSNDPDQCGAVVNYPAPTTTGTCGTVTCTPPSGSTFPKGTTTVNCTTTPGPSCSFTVTVNDTQAPTITCPANVMQATDANQCQAVVNYTMPTVSDNCPGVTTAKCSPPSGSVFQKGTTTVNCGVSDAAGLASNCSFTVTVKDMTAPSITCPGNISMPAATGVCSRVVTYSNATATDNCPGVGTPSCTPASGSTFQKGVTTVTCTVNDAASNPATCSFTVTITDTQPPSITCPGNQVRSTDAGMCSAVVSYAVPAATDNCPGVSVSCIPPSGSTFPKGVTTVNCTATDGAGLTAGCSFTVTVNDTQAPTLTCPANLIRTLPPVCPTTGAAGLTVTYALPIASDNCPGTTVACVPPSGTSFPMGTTTVTCTATDAAGNKASCSFKVKMFDVCLQDTTNAALVILWNSQTGEYAFCVNGQVYTGTGTLTKRGCTISLAHNTTQLRVAASIDFTMNRGTASIQSPPGSIQGSITDSDITNNSCNCYFSF